jgi:hypothetical protein
VELNGIIFTEAFMAKRVKVGNPVDSLVDPTEKFLRAHEDDYVAFEQHKYAKCGGGFHGSAHSAEQMFGDVENYDEAFNPLNHKR